MARYTNEAGLVRAIQREVAKRYPSAWVFKTVGGPRQASGIPDLLLSVEGRFIGLEVKFQRPGESKAHALGRATYLQQHQINLINHSGGTALVVTSVPDAMAAIESALEK